jgi:hypothetical protein
MFCPRKPQQEQNLLAHEEITARLRTTIEEELGSYQRFADLSSAEIERMSARLAKAIAPLLRAEEPARESEAA